LKISVIIPAFNAEQYLAQTVSSVLGQTHRDLEVIVVDDGSTDRTREVAESFSDARVRVLTGPNGGVSAARNRGAGVATGEILAFLDADDLWDRTKAQLHASEHAGDPHAVAIGSLMRYVDPATRTIGQTGQNPAVPDRDLVASGKLMPFALSSTTIRATAFDAVGGFDESLRGIPAHAEDLDLVARLAGIGELRLLPEILGSYRIHPQSASAQYQRSQQLGARFVRARISARRSGRDLSWDEFLSDHRPTRRQAYGDWVRRRYRLAGLAYAERRYWRAGIYGSVAVIAAPRYSIRRLATQLEKFR
jgi:glycosyltransferase involved in cell wall biosynthesis